MQIAKPDTTDHSGNITSSDWKGDELRRTVYHTNHTNARRSLNVVHPRVRQPNGHDHRPHADGADHSWPNSDDRDERDRRLLCCATCRGKALCYHLCSCLKHACYMSTFQLYCGTNVAATLCLRNREGSVGTSTGTSETCTEGLRGFPQTSSEMQA
jgi:hypothetical protein